MFLMVTYVIVDGLFGFAEAISAKVSRFSAPRNLSPIGALEMLPLVGFSKYRKYRTQIQVALLIILKDVPAWKLQDLFL